MKLRHLLIAFLAALIIVVVGCAGPTKVLTAKTKAEEISLTQRPVVVFSLKTRNEVSTNYNPFLFNAFLLSRDGGGVRREEYRINQKAFASRTSVKDFYLAGLCVPPGRYILQQLDCICTDGFFVAGRGRIPLALGFEVKPDTVTYLGHLDAVNRKRQRDEMRSGGVLPLIDQSVTGLSSGTFDVSVSDESVEELEKFKAAFPVLKTYPIGRAILSPWKRLTDDDLNRVQKAEHFDAAFTK